MMSLFLTSFVYYICCVILFPALVAFWALMAGRGEAQNLSFEYKRSYIFVLVYVIRMAINALLALIAAFVVNLIYVPVSMTVSMVVSMVVNLILVAVYMSLFVLSLCLCFVNLYEYCCFLWMVVGFLWMVVGFLWMVVGKAAALVVNLILVAVDLSLSIVSYIFTNVVGFLWMVGKAAAAAAFSLMDESNINNDGDGDSIIDSSSGRPLRRSAPIAAKKSGNSNSCQIERPLRRSARIAARLAH
jgi:hypothetical protein